MKEFVLDAPVALGWLVDDPSSAYARHVQKLMVDGARAVVPVHWHLEIASGKDAPALPGGPETSGAAWRAAKSAPWA